MALGSEPEGPPRSPEATIRVAGGDEAIKSTVKSLRKLMGGICDPRKNNADGSGEEEEDNQYDLYLHEQYQHYLHDQDRHQDRHQDQHQDQLQDQHRPTHDPTWSPPVRPSSPSATDGATTVVASSTSKNDDSNNPPPLVDGNGATATPSEEKDSLDSMDSAKKVLFPNEKNDEPLVDETTPIFEESCDNSIISNNSNTNLEIDPIPEQRHPRDHLHVWTRTLLSIAALVFLALGTTILCMQTTDTEGLNINEVLDRIRKYRRTTHLQERSTIHPASVTNDVDSTIREASLPPKTRRTTEETNDHAKEPNSWLDTMYDDAEEILRLTYDRTQLYLREAVGEILETLGHQKNKVLEKIYEHHETIQSEQFNEPELSLNGITKYYSELVDIRNVTVALELFLKYFSGNSTWEQMGINVISKEYFTQYIPKTLELVRGEANLEHVHKIWTSDLTKRIRNMRVFDEDDIYNKLNEIGDTIARFYHESGLHQYVERLEQKLADAVGETNMTIVDAMRAEILDRLAEYYQNNPLSDYLQLRPLLSSDIAGVDEATASGASSDECATAGADSTPERETDELDQAETGLDTDERGAEEEEVQIVDRDPSGSDEESELLVDTVQDNPIETNDPSSIEEEEEEGEREESSPTTESNPSISDVDVVDAELDDTLEPEDDSDATTTEDETIGKHADEAADLIESDQEPKLPADPTIADSSSGTDNSLLTEMEGSIPKMESKPSLSDVGVVDAEFHATLEPDMNIEGSETNDKNSDETVNLNIADQEPDVPAETATTDSVDTEQSLRTEIEEYNTTTESNPMDFDEGVIGVELDETIEQEKDPKISIPAEEYDIINEEKPLVYDKVDLQNPNDSDQDMLVPKKAVDGDSDGLSSGEEHSIKSDVKESLGKTTTKEQAGEEHDDQPEGTDILDEASTASENPELTTDESTPDDSLADESSQGDERIPSELHNSIPMGTFPSENKEKGGEAKDADSDIQTVSSEDHGTGDEIGEDLEASSSQSIPPSDVSDADIKEIAVESPIQKPAELGAHDSKDEEDGTDGENLLVVSAETLDSQHSIIEEATPDSYKERNSVRGHDETDVHDQKDSGNPEILDEGNLISSDNERDSTIQSPQTPTSAQPARDVPDNIPDMIKGIEYHMTKMEQSVAPDLDKKCSSVECMIEEIEAIVDRTRTESYAARKYDAADNFEERNPVVSKPLSVRRRWNSLQGWMQRR